MISSVPNSFTPELSATIIAAFTVAGERAKEIVKTQKSFWYKNIRADMEGVPEVVEMEVQERQDIRLCLIDSITTAASSLAADRSCDVDTSMILQWYFGYARILEFPIIAMYQTFKAIQILVRGGGIEKIPNHLMDLLNNVVFGTPPVLHGEMEDIFIAPELLAAIAQEFQKTYGLSGHWFLYNISQRNGMPAAHIKNIFDYSGYPILPIKTPITRTGNTLTLVLQAS